MNIAQASARRRLSLAAQASLLAGPFLSMVDSNIVNVALPDIATQLHTALGTVQWILSGYLLALAAGLAVTAYLAKRFGTRRVYLVSLLGFTLASALCALSPTIGFLIAMCAVQGALGAAHLPAPVRAQLAQAAVTGFHDTIWLLVLLAALGSGAALLLRPSRPAAAGASRGSE
jgi:MFS family permease